MNTTGRSQEPAPTIAELYPHLRESERAAAQENLTRYAALLARMADRIASDPEALTRFRRLTAGTGTLGSGTDQRPAC